MARGNMIVTLVANTKKFAKGMKDAGTTAKGFGTAMAAAGKVGIMALVSLASSIVFFIPQLINMGEEARKSELRLANIAKTTGLFGKDTENVTKRMSKFAETLSFATGVDDELIRGNEAVLLTFKNLAKSADKAGGPFDRATTALLDLEAAGKSVSAVQLGKALENPIKNMKALRKAGISFTDAEVDQIKALQEHNDILGAQDIILSKIEGQVGGTAEATASATDKMNARFEDLMETVGGALLPAVDEIATAFGDWMDSAEGKQAIDDLTKSLLEFGDWFTSPSGKKALEDFKTLLTGIADSMAWLGANLGPWFDLLKNAPNLISLITLWADFNKTGGFGGPGGGGPGKVPSGGPGSAPGGSKGRPNVTVNVKGITPSAAIGRNVTAAINANARLGRG